MTGLCDDRMRELDAILWRELLVKRAPAPVVTQAQRRLRYLMEVGRRHAAVAEFSEQIVANFEEEQPCE